MPPGSGDTNATLSFQVQGTEEATQRIENFARAVERLNGGAASVQGGESSFGSLTPPGAPRPGDGLGNYGTSPTMGGTSLPPGPNSGVLLSGAGYASSSPLAAGALAPNPLTGTAPGGAAGAGSGNTTIMASNVTIVGGGSGNGGAGGWPGGAMPSWDTPAGSGAPPAGGGSPFPGWNPFGGGGGGQPGQGFVNSVYNSMPGGAQGAMAQRFLGQTPLGRQMMGMGANFEGFMPAGMAEGLGGTLGKFAPALGVAMMARDALATGLHIAADYQTPAIYQQIRERSYNVSGTLYDPLQKAHDERLTRIEQNDRATEALYNSSFMKVVRFVNPFVDYQHDTVYRPGVARAKSENDAFQSFSSSRRRFNLTTGVDTSTYRGRFGETGNDLFQEKVAYNEGLGSQFSYGQAKPSFGLDYGEYGEFRNTPDLVNAASGRVASYMTSPGFEAQAGQAMRGRDMREFFPQALASAIARSDFQSIHDMGPLFVRAAGGDLAKGLAMQQAAMKRGLAMQTSQTGSAIGMADLSAGQARIGFLGASGASGYTLAGMTGTLAASYDPVVAGAQTKLDAMMATSNPLEIARARAELAQAQASQQEMRKSGAMMAFSTRQTEIGTESSLASTSLTRAMYQGSEGSVAVAFGKQGMALQDRVGLLRKMAASPFISPEERKQYAAEAASAQTELEISLPRQVGEFRLGLRQGELGIAGSRAATQAEHAALYGGISEVYTASLSQAGITGRQLGQVGQQLAGDFGPRTQQERLDLQKQQIDLQRQLNIELEQAKRSFASANLSVAQFSQGVISTQANYRQAFFGVGGAEAGTNQGAVVGASRASLSVAQKNFDAVASLPADNPYRQQRERELLDAKMGAQGAVQDFAHLPVSVNLQREQAAGEFRMSAMMRSYLPFGDVRGTVAGLMRNVGEQGKELGAQQRQGLAAIESDTSLTPQEKAARRDTLLRDFEGRRYGLGNQLLNYQGQLETGWQDRLISSTVGMPGRGALVASRFTQKEASHFLQNYSSVFGFSGEGAESQRDMFRFRGPRLADSVIGVIQRPDGFAETAMAMAGGGNMGGGGVLRPRVNAGGSGTAGGVEGAAQALVAAIVAAVGNGGQGNNAQRMGGATNFLHSLGNAPNVFGSDHAKGSSHQ